MYGGTLHFLFALALYAPVALYGPPALKLAYGLAIAIGFPLREIAQRHAKRKLLFGLWSENNHLEAWPPAAVVLTLGFAPADWWMVPAGLTATLAIACLDILFDREGGGDFRRLTAFVAGCFAFVISLVAWLVYAFLT